MKLQQHINQPRWNTDRGNKKRKVVGPQDLTDEATTSNEKNKEGSGIEG